MAYVIPSDFRSGSGAEHCINLVLDSTTYPDPMVSSAIEAAQQRVDTLTDDHFEPENLTLDLDVDSAAERLYLPRRVRSITSVSTRNFTGALTAENAAAYRTHTSLNAAGTDRLTPTSNKDWLQIIPDGVGLTTGMFWPVGPQTVRVTGSFSWAATPGDIKKAVALITWDRLMRESGDIRRASRWQRGDLTVERATDSLTGIPEADDLIEPFIRSGKNEIQVLIG
jgi:hypothetical protein